MTFATLAPAVFSAGLALGIALALPLASLGTPNFRGKPGAKAAVIRLCASVSAVGIGLVLARTLSKLA